HSNLFCENDILPGSALQFVAHTHSIVTTDNIVNPAKTPYVTRVSVEHIIYTKIQRRATAQCVQIPVDSQVGDMVGGYDVVVYVDAANPVHILYTIADPAGGPAQRCRAGAITANESDVQILQVEGA